MYIVQVCDFNGNYTYFRAKNLTEANLYKDTTLKFVKIFSAHEFLSQLPVVPLKSQYTQAFEDYLL